MAQKLTGTITIGAVTFDINRAAGDFNNNPTGRKYVASTLFFPRCCRNGNRTRSISITTDDIVQAGALEDCAAPAAEFQIPLTGTCGSDDCIIQTVSGVGTAYVRNLNIPTTEANTVIEATFDLIIINENGDGLEPVEIVTSP